MYLCFSAGLCVLNEEEQALKGFNDAFSHLNYSAV